jgi:hypothetical protein
MVILEEDKKYLENKGLNYEVYEENGYTLIVIKNYQLPDLYTKEMVDILIRVPPMYPVSKLDMFWVYPEIKLSSNNRYPDRADVFNNYLKKRWQRFSRHYNWRPGIDSLASHMKTIERTLKNP